jgi:hypothetical protein
MYAGDPLGNDGQEAALQRAAGAATGTALQLIG